MGAIFKYFSDVGGDAIELARIEPMPNKDFADRFPGVMGFRYDGYQKFVGFSAAGQLMALTRKIEYKRFASRHECNAKCMNGKCNGTCECKCGGKNHGRGAFLE